MDLPYGYDKIHPPPLKIPKIFYNVHHCLNKLRNLCYGKISRLHSSPDILLFLPLLSSLAHWIHFCQDSLKGEFHCFFVFLWNYQKSFKTKLWMSLYLSWGKILNRQRYNLQITQGKHLLFFEFTLLGASN
jgi:hypothetical protein